MTITARRACFEIHSSTLASSFDCEPFGFAHSLSELDLFSLNNLQQLASRYREGDYFVAAGAASPGTAFYSVRHSDCTPREAIGRLAHGNQRILLKRPEQYDGRFHELLQTLFGQLVQLRGGIPGVIRLDSAILISSSATTTPFHFDPETSFFFQIAGAKDYHIYSPSVLAEPELERFYVKGITNIAQVSLIGRDVAREHVFGLGPGKGMHQPRNAPHWVQTNESISVSYVFSFETEVTRALARTRALNHYQRAVGVRPLPVGANRKLDALKADAMRVVFPARKSVGTVLRALGRR